MLRRSPHRLSSLVTSLAVFVTTGSWLSGCSSESKSPSSAEAGATENGSGGSSAAGAASVNGGSSAGDSTGGSGGAKVAQAPNIIVILADDLGYGDLSSYGHEQIDTPRIDQLAAEGQRWTDFYATASICSPTRSALLTGRHQVRVGVYGSSKETWVFKPEAKTGLPLSEVTIAEVLGDVGYATAMFGKWHLGDKTEFMPNAQGFDYFYGVPYSNNQQPLTLWRNTELLEPQAAQATLTRNFTDEATSYIREHSEERFFMYFSHTAPHLPLAPHPDFAGQSDAGQYGDVVEELDWSVGQIVDTLKETGIEDQTLIIFTSDNGGANYASDYVSNGPFAGGKTTDREGGYHVPAVTWWPGTIQAGQEIRALGTTMDIFATAAGLAGAVAPEDRVYDSVDLGPVLKSGEGNPREVFFYYRLGELRATRMGDFKMVGNALYNLREDPGETSNVRSSNPEVAAQINSAVETHLATLERGESVLDVQ